MSSLPAPSSIAARFGSAVESLRCRLADVFPGLVSMAFVDKKDRRQRLYTMPQTLQMAVEQCLSKRSCAQAVQGFALQRAKESLPPISVATGGYCRARQRLPLEKVDSFRDLLAAAAVKGCSKEGLWRGHSVKLLDGTCISMPDTPANRENWPHPDSHKEGVGFPTMRAAGLFCLATGMILAMAQGPYRESEIALARKLSPLLSPGDVLVRDRLFSGYGMTARLLSEGIETVVRLKEGARNYTVVRNLGPGDQLIRLQRPKRPSDGMDAKEYAKLPDELTVRLVHVSVVEKGFRTKSYRLLTTLCDASAYPPQALAELYRRRWEVEIDILQLKSLMPEGVLRSRSPKSVKLEFALYQLVYNMVREMMLRAATFAGFEKLRRVSFERARGGLEQLLGILAGSQEGTDSWLIDELARLLAAGLNPLRPGRSEPRAIKKKKKDYPNLRVPRHEFEYRSKSSKTKPPRGTKKGV